MNLIEQLNDLCTEYECGALALSVVTDIRAIIEQDKRESACQYGKDVGMPQYSCAVKCQYEQPSHTKLIVELVEALEIADELIGVEPCEHVAQEAADGHRAIRAAITKAREAIK